MAVVHFRPERALDVFGRSALTAIILFVTAGSIAPIRARPGTPRALVCRARASKAKDVVIPDADYKLPGALLAIGAGSFAAHR